MSDPFEQGIQAFLSIWQTKGLPPICPYDPARDTSLYEEWFAGYEYAGMMSLLPERTSVPKTERLFGPFRALLNNKENPSP